VRSKRSNLVRVKARCGGCIVRLAGVVAILILPLTPALAESNRSIVGHIYDRSTGAPVADAIVRIAGTAQTTHSDARGRFEIRNIPPGRVAITVERLGYRVVNDFPVDIAEGFEQVVRIPLDPLPALLPAQEVTGRRVEPSGARRIELTAQIRRDAGSLVDVLRTVPGVSVYGTTESPGGTRVSVGGEPPHRVAVLLNGLPVSGGPDGAVDLSTIPVAAVTAIEVLPGSRSATAGDAGIGGAVNLITAPPKPERTLRVEGEGGRFGQHREAAVWSDGRDRYGWRLGLDRSGRGSRFRYPDGDTTALRRNTAVDRIRGFGQLNSRSRPELEILTLWEDAVYGAPGPLEEESDSAQSDNRHVRVQGQWRARASGAASVTLAAWYEDTREAYEKPEAIALDTEFRERFVGVRLEGSAHRDATEGRLVWESRHRRLTGADFLRPRLAFGTRERFEHDLRGTVTSRRRFSFGTLAATLSAALNLADDAGPHFAPRADLAWQREFGRWRGQVRAGWGRSFRRPRLTSLFWKADASSRGNPDLRPERASEWDVGLNLSRGGLDCDTRYFERSLTDVIVWDKRGVPPAYQPVNLDAAYVAGREDQIRYTIDRNPRRLTVAYTHVFTDSHDRTGDRQYNDSMLVFTPRHTHALSLYGSWGRLSVHGDARWVSRRFTLRAGTKWLDPYRVFDTGCEFNVRRARPRAVLRATITNLTNERIELLGRYPSPARTWTLGATLEF